ncbi:hypothetical protein GCM10007417_28750 [Glycocaulis alkaliphilus]|nr:hypothetical protein GCM10007417_28750 [Glycocaulis alkaliphilus]
MESMRPKFVEISDKPIRGLISSTIRGRRSPREKASRVRVGLETDMGANVNKIIVDIDEDIGVRVTGRIEP